MRGIHSHTSILCGDTGYGKFTLYSEYIVIQVHVAAPEDTGYDKLTYAMNIF